jgi:hypothetical protein
MAIKRKIILEADVKDATTKIDTLGKSIENVDDAAISSKVGFDVMKEGVLGVGLALKALGIGLIVSAFVALKNLFGQNQMAMDLFTTASESLKVVFNKIVELATKVGSTLSSAFSDPKQAIADLWEALKKNIVNRFEGFIDQWKAVGKVIKGVFNLDWDAVTEGATEFGQALIQTTTGLDVEQQENFINGVKKIVKEIATTTKEATAYGKAITKMRNEVKLAEAQQRLLQMQYQKDAELQRQLRDDISLTIDERIDANTKLGEILDEQFAKEKKLADKKLELAEKELSVNKDNVDLQVAVTNAKTELADLEERITGQRSEQLVNLTGLEKEKQDAIDETIAKEKEAAQKLIDIANKEADEKKKIVADRIAAVKAMEISGAQSMLGAIGQLAGEGTKMAKATALASILINTAQAISGAVKAGAGIPFPANLGAILTGVGAALAGIASAKAVFAKVPGGGDTPDTPTSIPSPSGMGGNLIPNLEAITPTELGGATPVQAYVVENDISDAQALQEELDIQSTL